MVTLGTGLQGALGTYRSWIRIRRNRGMDPSAPRYERYGPIHGFLAIATICFEKETRADPNGFLR